MILFQREQAHTCFEEAIPLINNYRHEIAYYTDFDLKPGFEKYAELEKIGALRAYTAREDDKLIGFAVFFVYPHLHFQDNIFAMHDIMYITPEKRGFGHKFIKWCDEQLKADGVSVVYFSVNRNFDYGIILRRLGYKHVEDGYSRRMK